MKRLSAFLRIFIFAWWAPIGTSIAEDQSIDLTPHYEFIDVQYETGECPEGTYCLLAPYLSVAIFADKRREGRKTAIILDDYFYCHPKSGEVYQVPPGFETDFLSIPGIAQGYVKPRDFMEAAVVHDWLYAVGEDGKRKHADDVFRDVLAETGASLIKRNAMHRAVRTGGNDAYGADEEWRFIDLESMKQLNPAPYVRPETASVATIDCADVDAFKELRDSRQSPYVYTASTDEFLVHSGFVAAPR